MWTWDQSAGQLLRDGKLVSRGYAGRGRGLNNPAMEEVRNIGPLPAGRYKLVAMRTSANTGPLTIVLDPVDAVPGNDRHEPTGRGAFRIHGDNAKGNQSASYGCIILPRAVRLAMWASGDRLIEVVA